MQLLKISAAEQEKASGLGIVVCWSGDLESGFYYTDSSHSNKLEGVLVEMVEDENPLP